MTTQAETKPEAIKPTAEPEATAPNDPPPPDTEPELRCTICGLRACWTK